MGVYINFYYNFMITIHTMVYMLHVVHNIIIVRHLVPCILLNLEADKQKFRYHLPGYFAIKLQTANCSFVCGCS